MVGADQMVIGMARAALAREGRSSTGRAELRLMHSKPCRSSAGASSPPCTSRRSPAPALSPARRRSRGRPAGGGQLQDAARPRPQHLARRLRHRLAVVAHGRVADRGRASDAEPATLRARWARFFTASIARRNSRRSLVSSSFSTVPTSPASTRSSSRVNTSWVQSCQRSAGSRAFRQHAWQYRLMSVTALEFCPGQRGLRSRPGSVRPPARRT